MGMERIAENKKMKPPNFYKDRQPPKGYYDTPDPYAEMNMSVDLRGIHKFAQKSGKEMTDLSYEEMMRFMRR